MQFKYDENYSIEANKDKPTIVNEEKEMHSKFIKKWWKQILLYSVG